LCTSFRTYFHAHYTETIKTTITEIEVANYEEVGLVGDYNSPQPTIITPTVDGSKQPTPNQNSYNSSAQSTPRLVGNIRDQRPESVTKITAMAKYHGIQSNHDIHGDRVNSWFSSRQKYNVFMDKGTTYLPSRSIAYLRAGVIGWAELIAELICDTVLNG